MPEPIADTLLPPATEKYRTTPWPTEKMSPGIPYIIGNEAAERFSFYGMMAILVTFLTKHLINAQGELAPMSEARANEVTHLFIMGVYFFPIIGAVVSDVFFGKYRTILYVSLLYCLGHGALALVDVPRLTGIEPLTLLFIGLLLISIGAGGIKPCVSAHVGDQFGPSNKRLIERVFTWFYFSINFGAAFSTLLTPLLLDKEKYFATFGSLGSALQRFGIEPGPGLAFGVPGVLMALATLVFWLGRNKFVHIPPGGTAFLREVVSADGMRAARNLIPLFLLISIFFALFDQSHTSWVLQADKMDRHLFTGTHFEVNPDPAQFQAVNPILVLIFIPLFAYVIYPTVSRVFPLTPLRKIAIGMFVTIPSFALIAMAQERIDAGQTPHITWQIGAYLILTAAEIMVSITALEFSYTQSPRKMKSFTMGMYLLFSIALGNFFASQVNGFIARREEAGQPILEGAAYYWFFTGAMLAMAIAFAVYAQFYRGQTYIQGEDAPVH
ncbi:MAG: POT family MFS transporter [Pirellulales bacterium]|nr:POT family MFS transporter [Pirellulales bacterium]